MSISTIHARESAGRIVGRLRQAAIALAAAVLAACGGGDAAGPAPSGACGASECGTALVTMTDAPGDFVSYAVDITSLQLRRANGTEVETLPVTTRIDFTELVDLDEVLSAGQVPYGSYVAATLRLDFADAEILVEGETGEPVEVSPVDGAGQPLGAVELDVQLDGRGQLAVSPGQIARLAFDLNLAASNTVNLAAGTVTVSPFVVASVVPQAEREARVRGRLASVDVAAGTYTIDVRPFKLRTQVLGQLVVHTTSSTSFEINGEVFSGSAGIAQLATLAADRPMVIAFGTFAPATHAFTAQRVLAGTSGEDPRHDLLSGNVIAREGNSLIVGGVRLDRRDGRSGFERGRVTLTVGPDTRVTRAGQSGGTYDIDDISVGQRIHARGDLSGSSTGGFTLDATAGAVRLDFTRLFGTVTARTVGNLTLALRSIDGRPATLFDFAGTGSSTALDADPAAYEVATSVLALPGIAADSYTRVLGFVTPFGLAPPDFQAVSVLDFAEARAALGIDWTPGGSTTPFVTLAADALTVDLVDPALHGGAITVGGRLVRLGALTTDLVLVPAAESRLLFAIAHRGTGRIENFATFADFSARLGTALAGGTPMLKLVADGRFDSANGTFRARQLLVVLAN